jgi:hypothetical protein
MTTIIDSRIADLAHYTQAAIDKGPTEANRVEREDAHRSLLEAFVKFTACPTNSLAECIIERMRAVQACRETYE